MRRARNNKRGEAGLRAVPVCAMRAQQLGSKASGLLGATEHAITIIATIPTVEPRETTDYLTIPAKQTTCELLRAVLRSGAQLLGSDASGVAGGVDGILP